MKKIKIIFASFILFISLLLSSIFLAACGGTQKIYFGNYESYMSKDVEKSLSGEYNVDFQYYKTNEQLLREFDQNYDLAVPSTYAVVEMVQNNQLEKLDWTKFGIEGIDNALTALDLFIPEIRALLTENDLNDNGVYGEEEDNLLHYSVPYFFQDFILSYKPSKLTIPQDLSNWKSVFENTKQNDLITNRAIAIEDARTLFSLGKLVEGENVDVNPSPNENTIEQFDTVYNFLYEYFGDKNKIIFNSDSGNVLNDIANPNGSDIAIMYNGDVLYAMQGGDEFSVYNEEGDITYIPDVDFIRPTLGSNISLDLVVMKKSNNEKLKDTLYEIINRLTLTPLEFDEVIDADTGEITYEVPESNLTYWNFDFVQYTAPLQNLYDYVIDEVDGYFVYEGLDPQYLEYSKKLIEVFKVTVPEGKTPGTFDGTKRIENKITQLQKSNMLISFLKTKSNL
ncbi:MAG: hypothetical protein ACRCVI_00230 [Mycoplasmoidaceae bacterium]